MAGLRRIPVLFSTALFFSRAMTVGRRHGPTIPSSSPMRILVGETRCGCSDVYMRKTAIEVVAWLSLSFERLRLTPDEDA
jgi:hypothetical protein